jgi:hypothetical protein
MGSSATSRVVFGNPQEAPTSEGGLPIFPRDAYSYRLLHDGVGFHPLQD